MTKQGGFYYQNFHFRYEVGNTLVGVQATEQFSEEVKFDFAFQPDCDWRYPARIESAIKRQAVKLHPSLKLKNRDARLQEFIFGKLPVLTRIVFNHAVLALQGKQFAVANERQLQEAAEPILAAQSRTLAEVTCEWKREYDLTEQDRIDFFCEGVGLEIKVAGSSNEVLRQLHRYAQCDEIKALILLTTRTQHKSLPRLLNNKPVHVACLALNGML